MLKIGASRKFGRQFDQRNELPATLILLADAYGENGNDKRAAVLIRQATALKDSHLKLYTPYFYLIFL